MKGGFYFFLIVQFLFCWLNTGTEKIKRQYIATKLTDDFRTPLYFNQKKKRVIYFFAASLDPKNTSH